MQLAIRCEQHGSIAFFTKEGKTVPLKREITRELVEIHGVVASKEEWFFCIIPLLQVQQRVQQLQHAT